MFKLSETNTQQEYGHTPSDWAAAHNHGVTSTVRNGHTHSESSLRQECKTQELTK